MNVSTWSWVLLQNEHLISSSSWRLENMIPVCRGSDGSQYPLKFTVGAAHRAKASVSAEHRKMLRLEAKRSLAFGHHFSQIKLRKRWFAP